MSLLKVESLNAKIGKFFLKDISFSLKEGEVLGIAGESGSGKTLLSHLILRLIKDYKIKQGSIRFLGENLLEIPESKMQNLRGLKLSYIFQEPLSALNPLQKIDKQLSEAILIHNPKITSCVLQERINTLLTNVQLPKSVLESYPYVLSGGQRQRVCIAIALANNPKILIADEPTTALDSTTQAQIIELLKNLQKSFGLSIIFISHNLAVISKLCNRVLIMQDGEIIESGGKEEIFKTPKNAYTKMLIDALAFHYNKESYEKEVVLEAKNISVEYPKKKSFFGKTLESFTALKPLSFSLYKRESLGVIGESGSGKSSLANALCRLADEECVKGEIRLLGRDFLGLKGSALREFRASIQLIFQDPFSSLNPKMNLFKILQEGLQAHICLDKESQKRRIIQSLEDVGLDASYMERYPNELSGGQRQRVSIARSLILRPKVLILDEPTSALDCATQRQILKLLLKLTKQYGLSYICISHDLSVIATLCQNVLVLKEGNVLESGLTQEVFSSPKNAYVKELLQASAIGNTNVL
ncbi:ABC transporter ATP-binding protein [Helicobacter sp. MIT 11-5569]|uniref:dipeptide ABC transporter ATP-binding protein n=1 Tax=Helicobacter sp. MIT 11-5569 TaxID=1548151 RepID=UPI00051FBD8D|nr:dipeptide ABC transporter ATP-binding protein [Helicobacter sp. MIT 11-5569]TLD83180.1 ABC transporter ATP-binding protein [Helicobacter sp. MIT 11-5569]